mgnify:FL=1
MKEQIYAAYTAILKEELIPALGCTEPSAVAFTAAKASELLGRRPEHLTVECSGNIIKNVKGVIVPASNGRKGIDTSAVLGMLTGHSELGLELLSTVTPDILDQLQPLLDQGICTVKLIENVPNLNIRVTATAGTDTAIAEVANGHTHLVHLEKNGEVLLHEDVSKQAAQSGSRALLNMEDIYDYALHAPLDEVGPIVDRQVEYNCKISQEGLRGDYGANVGRCLLAAYGDALQNRARAAAAAGSDARMGGCMLPVVINSGSGNQGMTVSIPVAEYAKAMSADQDTLHRALLLSNLTAIYLKSGIGKLSAYCGAVGAAVGAGAAITWLRGGDYAAISRTVTNALADVSGIVCDGAKASCAAKIASALDAALLAGSMAERKQTFAPGEGLVADSVDQTIQNISRLGRDGMRTTDVEILNIMIGQ